MGVHSPLPYFKESY